MILSTVKVADLDQFLETFSTKGAEKRAAWVQGLPGLPRSR